ncbi:unnamed protein product [Knipowitschia caucasica]
MARERVKKKSYQESLEEIKEKMKEKRNKRLASVSAPNRGRSRMITKCNGTSSTNTILIGVQQNNKALAVALQAEKEKVRQGNAVILQLKREQQALFLHLLLLKKRLKDQEALSANSSGSSSAKILPTSTIEYQRNSQGNKSVDESPQQKDSPLCAGVRADRLPSTVGVRRRPTGRSSSRRRSNRVQEYQPAREDAAACFEALTASPICSEDANQRQMQPSDEPVLTQPEEFQHSTPEPAPAKSTTQAQPGRKQPTRAKAEAAQKKPERGRKAERGPLKKPWENSKPRARSKSRDRSAARSKTALAAQNKLNTSLGFNDTFDFDCEEAVHVTPFKAKAEDDEPELTTCKDAEKQPSVVSFGTDSLSPSSESEDSLYVPQKRRKKHMSPVNSRVINTRRGRRSKRVKVSDENIPPHLEFDVYRDVDSSPKFKRASKEASPASCVQKGIYEENQTNHREVDIEENCLLSVSPLVEAEIKRIDDVLSNFGESSSDASAVLGDPTPQRAKSCKKPYRKFSRGGSRLSDVRCSAQGPGRKRRCTLTVNYKEPSLSAKLRRGDKFTDVEFLSSPIFKQKSGRRSIQKSRSSMKMQQPFEKYNESFVGCR